MDQTFKRLTCYIFFFSALLTQSVMVNCRKHEEHKHRKLFVFGDSYADTGNLGKLGEFTPCWYEPYGMSLPKGPSGRFSDGWIFTDYLAKFLGIKTPVPYKYRRVYPTHPYGMNFAVGGSGVFDTGNFQRNLSAQIDTFQEQIKEGVFTKQDVENSVIYVSAAGNDYIYYLDNNHNVSELSGFIAKVTDQVALNLKRLGEIGAGKIVVANLGPVQCTPELTRKATNYTKCNDFYDFGPTKHNQLLVEAVKKLNAKSSRARFLVLNLYSASIAVMNHPEKGEGRLKQVLKPCCEGKTPDDHCGAVTDEGKLYSVCHDPENYFYFDTVHPTQAAWAAVYNIVLPWLRKHL